MNPMTLCFVDSTLERRYRRHQLDAAQKLSRITIPLSCVLFASYGLVEITLHDHFEILLMVRTTILAVVIGLFLLSRHARVRHHTNVIMCLISLATAAGSLLLFHLERGHEPQAYFISLLMIIFWTYTLLGLQFIYAMACGLLIWLGCTASCIVLHIGTGILVEINEVFFMMATNLLGGMSAYARERQSRQLFLHECQITDERDDLRDHAMCDSLTGLLNRRALLERLDQILDIRTPGMVQAALFIDLDGFKPVNDRHGHHVGDQVLRIIGDRLGATLRGNDIVGRLGGDEFLVLISREGDTRKGPEQLARRLIEAISHPIHLDINDEPLILGVSASVGISLFPFSGATPDKVIARADSAMYEAKQRGRGIVVTDNPLRLVL